MYGMLKTVKNVCIRILFYQTWQSGSPGALCEIGVGVGTEDHFSWKILGIAGCLLNKGLK